MNCDKFDELFEIADERALTFDDVVRAIANSEAVLYKHNREYCVEVIDINFGEDDSILVPNEIGDRIVNDPDVVKQTFEGKTVYRYDLGVTGEPLSS